MQFLAEELNKYLNSKFSGTDVSRPLLVVDNIALAADSSSPEPGLRNKAVLTLVNVEEESISGQHGNLEKSSILQAYKNPRLNNNLYILLSMNRTNYGESLDFLSHIITFFQNQSVFTPISHPTLDPSIQRLMVERNNVSFEQANQLWTILGGKYLPSVIYKVRQVTLDE